MPPYHHLLLPASGVPHGLRADNHCCSRFLHWPTSPSFSCANAHAYALMARRLCRLAFAPVAGCLLPRLEKHARLEKKHLGNHLDSVIGFCQVSPDAPTCPGEEAKEAAAASSAASSPAARAALGLTYREEAAEAAAASSAASPPAVLILTSARTPAGLSTALPSARTPAGLSAALSHRRPSDKGGASVFFSCASAMADQPDHTDPADTAARLPLGTGGSRNSSSSSTRSSNSLPCSC